MPHLSVLEDKFSSQQVQAGQRGTKSQHERSGLPACSSAAAVHPNSCEVNTALTTTGEALSAVGEAGTRLGYGDPAA